MKKGRRGSGKEEEVIIHYLRICHSIGKILGISHKNTELQVEEDDSINIKQGSPLCHLSVLTSILVPSPLGSLEVASLTACSKQQEVLVTLPTGCSKSTLQLWCGTSDRNVLRSCQNISSFFLLLLCPSSLTVLSKILYSFSFPPPS